MSTPEPMRCIHPSDECPSPLACNAAGGCREAQKDAAKSYTEALAECRARGVIPETWKDRDHG